jgi:hypothetical protein
MLCAAIKHIVVNVIMLRFVSVPIFVSKAGCRVVSGLT